MAEKRKRSLPSVTQKKIKLTTTPQVLPEVDNTRKDINKYYSKLISKYATDRPKLIKKILGLLGEDLLSASKKHDMCRVLQACLKYGTEPQKSVIYSKLSPDFCELASGKYSYFLATKLMKYRNKEEMTGNKEELMERVLKNAKKMLGSPFAIRFLENMYVDGGFKGRILAALLGEEVEGVFEKEKIEELKALLGFKKILKRGLLDYTLIMHIVYLYLSISSEPEQLEILSSLPEKFESLFKSRYGTILAIQSLAISDTKQRKNILKLAQPLIPKILEPDSQAYLFFIKLICVIDDTKRVNKMISMPIMQNMKKMVQCSTGVKFLSNLSPFPNSLANLSTNELQALEESLNTTSKKSVESKKSEVFSHIFSMLSLEVTINFDMIINDARLNCVILTVALGILNKCGKNKQFVQKVGESIVNWDVMDHNIGHRMLKRIVEAEVECGEKVFTKMFLKVLEEKKEYIEKLVKSRGVWVFVSLVEKSGLKNKCRKVFLEFKDRLSTEKIGEKALLELLNKKNVG